MYQHKLDSEGRPVYFPRGPGHQGYLASGADHARLELEDLLITLTGAGLCGALLTSLCLWPVRVFLYAAVLIVILLSIAFWVRHLKLRKRIEQWETSDIQFGYIDFHIRLPLGELGFVSIVLSMVTVICTISIIKDPKELYLSIPLTLVFASLALRSGYLSYFRIRKILHVLRSKLPKSS